MHIIRWLAACLAFVSAAASGGMLYSAPTYPGNYYDFSYQPAKSLPYSALSSPISLSVQFIWQGTAGTPITTPQHALAAFTQMTVPTGYYNPAGDQIWTHGAGAFVGEMGLEMELWIRQNGAANSIVWGQHNGRCARDVQGTLPPNTMCLSATSSPAGFITPSPSFALKRGVTYTLKVKISPTSAGWSKLEAELYQPSVFFGLTLIQSGSVGFENATFFPLVGQMLNAVVARTPGEPAIQYVVLP